MKSLIKMYSVFEENNCSHLLSGWDYKSQFSTPARRSKNELYAENH